MMIGYAMCAVLCRSFLDVKLSEQGLAGDRVAPAVRRITGSSIRCSIDRSQS